MTKAHTIRCLAVLAATATSFALAIPAANAADGAEYSPSVQRAAVNALSAHAGIGGDQALRHLKAQPAIKALGTQLTSRLGDRAAGFFLDPKSEKPVVNVLDPAAAQTVRAAGGTAKVVHHTNADLKAAKAKLDQAAGVPNTAWGIDPSTNQVVLTVSDAAKGAGLTSLLATAASLGDKVRIKHSTGTISTQIAGGDEIDAPQWICSAGFNVNRGGQNYIITAGHCTQGGPSWSGIGPSVDSSFPGTDYGLIQNDSGDAPGVVDLYNGSTQTITNAGDAQVGEQVCKSGRTTNLTCGTVQALNQTVDYGNGDVVNGLIQTDVYSDHGDSGGALFDGGTALGTVSGGDSTTDYFQPVTAAIGAYGVSLN
ncbi:S1 family peptidase [Solihabitans fulvus]|uniref:S1 family peptidase n=1 Tax=Solihabitans fulvus TaxID=1892852 RepID=A0A5B2X624_9PSEU|nr:S1 family peptidase [Solihabitans fulvus]KAA2258828.1 S1 family peptidase [Solihabitans fulvus]